MPITERSRHRRRFEDRVVHIAVLPPVGETVAVGGPLVGEHGEVELSAPFAFEKLVVDQTGDPDAPALKTVTGLFVDLLWWLDTCDDDEVDSHVAVQLQESSAACVDELPEEQRRRLLEVLDELAATEQHGGRRYELRFFPFAIGLVDDEPDAEEPPVREWVRPEARTAGPAAAR